MTPWATRWLFDSALAAGVILLIGSMLMALMRQPARRQRVGEWTIAACLVVAVLQGLALPRVNLGWVPANVGAGRVLEHDRGVEAFSRGQLDGTARSMKDGAAGAATVAAEQREQESWMSTAGAWVGGHWAMMLLGAYAAVALLAAGRMGMGHWKLRRMVSEALPAEGGLARMWEEMAAGVRRKVMLRVSTKVSRPICFGVWRPVVLIPARLARHAGGEEEADLLRIVLLHELVHVRRRDAVAWMLASAARVVFFYQPLLWHLQRQLRLAQEYIADAWAAEQASSPVAYAENLLRLLKEDIQPMPMSASAAVRGPSEFYRRMQRLLTEKTPTEKNCAVRWSAAGGVVALAAALVCSAVSVEAARNSGAAAVKVTAEGRGVAYLLGRQENSGGWLAEFGPAPTALVVRALLQSGMTVDSAEVQRGVAFLEGYRKSDHGFYGETEPTYNTAIVLSTLALIPGEKFEREVTEGKQFLESRQKAEASRKVGGWYAGAPNAERRAAWVDPGERSAEAVLETYGAMTYAGLKSMVYAGLTRDDSRVKKSAEWVKGNWTLEKNPGVGSAEGLYYYYHLVARTLRAAGENQVVDGRGRAHDWRAELSGKLTAVQRADGSWVNEASGRWLEDRPELVTAYAVLALQEAGGK